MGEPKPMSRRQNASEKRSAAATGAASATEADHDPFQAKLIQFVVQIDFLGVMEYFIDFCCVVFSRFAGR